MRSHRGQRTLRYELPWDGRPYCSGAVLALDTETVALPDNRPASVRPEIPQMVLGTVTDGTRHVVLRPEQVADFLCRHPDNTWVMQNAAFDYWVLWKTLSQQSQEPNPSLQLDKESRRLPEHALLVLGEIVTPGRLQDTMLLDFLVRLAEGKTNEVLRMRNLDLLAQDYLGRRVPKDDPYRIRFGELLGRDWSTVEMGFFDYAIKDTVATWEVFQEISHRAARLVEAAGISPEQIGQHGLLTHNLQLRASLVLAAIGREGMGLDRDEWQTVERRLRAQIHEEVDYLNEHYPRLFHKFESQGKKGELRTNKATALPLLRQDGLRGYLADIALQDDVAPYQIPLTPKGDKLGTSLDSWRAIAPDHSLIHHWGTLADQCKLLQFLLQLQGAEAVYPEYRVLVRTGRTSCHRPNIQQMPREPWFRELFTARPGNTLVIVDYSAIELRTLAAVLLDRFGQSKLAEVMSQGVDPHCYTAAMVVGLGYREFMALKQSDPERFKMARQAAKAINFGVPGGLGAKRLASYAKLQYGVDMSESEAADLKHQLCHTVYPELGRYLEQDTVPILCHNLYCHPDTLAKYFPGVKPWFWQQAANILSGRRVEGKQPTPDFLENVWRGFKYANSNPLLARDLDTRKPSEWLRRQIFGDTVATLTGRLRKGVEYCEARNTPFQGLAADGAKEALWRIHQAGYRIVLFVHDEIVVEVPEEQGEAALAEVSRLMIEAMEYVLSGRVPVAVEGHLSKVWSKG